MHRHEGTKKHEATRRKKINLLVFPRVPSSLRVLVSLSVVLFIFISSARAEFPTSQPYRAVTYEHAQRKGLYMSLFVVIVDLTDPNVSVRVVPGGPDPDGPGEWQTTLMPVKQIAEREKFDVAINASFFAITRPASAPIPEEVAEKSGRAATTQPLQQSGYRQGIWSKVLGQTMTDGKLWSDSNRENWPVVWVEGDRKVRIGMLKTIPNGARQIVAGNCYVLKDGKPPGPYGGAMAVRHPRTVVGTSKDGTKLVLLTVDGRRPGVSLGMTGEDLTAEMQRLGCWDAINLDGGGSTTLVMRDPDDGEYKVINQPSDGRERPVADVLGVSVKSN
jgi:exopolysaccharide biosynthesis protein